MRPLAFVADAEFLRLVTQIDGWMTQEEGEALAQLAFGVPREHHIVEIGAFAGRSSAWLAAGAAQGQHPSITCIDPWKPDCIPGSPGKQLAEAVHNLFRRNMAAVAEMLGSPPVHEWWASSDEVEWAGQSIGLLFLDSSKTPQQLWSDFARWSRFVPLDGNIVFHDDHPDHVAVQEFINEWLVNRPGWADEGNPAGSLRRFRRIP